MRTQAHRTSDVIDRDFRFTVPDLGPAAEKPGGRKVRIEGKRAVEVSGAAGPDGTCRAETVGEVTRERREHAHQQQGKRVAERPYLAADIKISRDRLLKNSEALASTDSDGQDDRAAGR